MVQGLERDGGDGCMLRGANFTARAGFGFHMLGGLCHQKTSRLQLNVLADHDVQQRHGQLLLNWQVQPWDTVFNWHAASQAGPIQRRIIKSMVLALALAGG